MGEMTKQLLLLSIDRDLAYLDSIESWFNRNGFQVTAVDAPSRADQVVKLNQFCAAIFVCSDIDNLCPDELVGLTAESFPTALLTDCDNAETKTAAGEIGIDRIVVKPIRMDDLKSVLSEQIAQSSDHTT